MSTDVFVDFRDAGFTYDGEAFVFRHLNLAVPQGQFLCLLGGNGSGKSTLAKHINALLLPDEGEVDVFGCDTRDAEQTYFIRSNAGLVFQNPDDQLVASLIENDVAFGPENLGIPNPELRERVTRALAEVGLMGFETHETNALSGGQKQRVAIARALATRPKYLLCDEATSALDPNTTQSILHLLKEINQTLGVTIVVITHEMRVIEQICQRVAVIDQSCIAEIGNVSDVFTHPKSDIAKALILPKSPAENLPPCTGRRLRLVFDGSCSNEPVISRITLECHVPVNILFADTRIVEGSIYGHMVIDLPDDPQQFHDVLRWLDHNHISYLQEDGSHV